MLLSSRSRSRPRRPFQKQKRCCRRRKDNSRGRYARKDISSNPLVTIDPAQARIEAVGRKERTDEENVLFKNSNLQRPYGAMMFNMENAETEDSDLE